MKHLIKIKSVKIALIVLILTVFLITLCPVYDPIVNVIRMLVGSCMIGWWTGRGIMKIWHK